MRLYLQNIEGSTQTYVIMPRQIKANKILYLNSAALFLVRYFYILKWHFWDLSIDMGIFWGSWFLHNHEIPHPNQWGSMITTKKYCLFNEDFSVVGFICI